MANQISRRAFLGQAAVTPATGIAEATARPKEAWVILATNWRYNDEYTYAEGEEVLPKVYFDRQEAEAECRRLCEQFFAGQTPLDFEVDPIPTWVSCPRTFPKRLSPGSSCLRPAFRPRFTSRSWRHEQSIGARRALG
jgi:hypothetical protein